MTESRIRLSDATKKLITDIEQKMHKGLDFEPLSWDLRIHHLLTHFVEDYEIKPLQSSEKEPDA